ncbi:MAG: threonine/serine exporter family protein [Clostridia bacterium]|nr:threonine/serine exporter family protein [Clostridia bacterium]
MTDILLSLLFGMVATAGFAGLTHAPRRTWLPASVVGGIGYMLYEILQRGGVAEPASMFAGVLCACILSQILARKMRVIATIFITLSIIPCVPGLGLYRTMVFLGQRQAYEALICGVNTMIDIMMIALAAGVSEFAVRCFQRK